MEESDFGDSGAYDNSHRAFLQAFFARSVLTFEEAKPILAAILTARDGRQTLPNDITFEDFNAYIHTIHNAIEKFGYDIRPTLPQTASSRSQDNTLHVLVNAVSDIQTQFATSHSADEIAFVKRLLDAMFDTNNTQSREVMAVKNSDALRLHKAPRDSAVGVNGTQGGATQTANSNLTMKDVERLLSTLLEENWLERSRAGFYTLSPRALMELRGYLEETYNEPDAEEGVWQPIKKCAACKDIITVGRRCANVECNVRLHEFCVQGYFRGQSVRKCGCGTEWTGENYVGERAARGYGAGRVSNAAASRSGRRTTVREDETDSDD